MMVNLIINNDSIIEMKKMNDESVDLIFADPPYWMRTSGVLKRYEGTDFDGVDDEWDKFNSEEEYNEFTRSWLFECKRVLKKNGSIWIISGMQNVYTVGGIMQELGFWIVNDVIWYKTNPTPNFMGTRLKNSHETLIWATKSEKSKYTFNYKTAKELNLEDVSIKEFDSGLRKQMGTIWRFPVVSGNERLKDEKGDKLHSTQKPEELLYRIIAISSKIGDLVLDPFGGTMTTAAVAKKMGRNFISIEKDEKYCEYGTKRISQVEVKIGEVETAQYDIKPTKVSLTEMIENNFFFEGEKFYLKNNQNTAILTKDGKIIIEGNKFDIHTGAAILIKGKAERVNGFDYWYVFRDNQMVSIKEVRENFRNKLLK